MYRFDILCDEVGSMLKVVVCILKCDSCLSESICVFI